jgi:hypothetical protein
MGKILPDTAPETAILLRRHRAQKLDRDKTQTLAAQGVTATDIAKHQGVAVSTVTRYLESIEPLRLQIRCYANNHADILTLSQAKKQAVEDLIVESWLSNPVNLLEQDVRLQKEIVHTMQGGRYYDHQSERLERGESTSIVDSGAVTMEIEQLRAAKEIRLSQIKVVLEAQKMLTSGIVGTPKREIEG